MANKIQHGICNVYLAKQTAAGTNSTAPTYSTPVAWAGAISLSVESDTSENNFAADNNAKYWSAFSNGGNSGSIEMAYMPDAIKSLLYDWRVDSNGGMVETEGASQNIFALLYQVEGDDEARRVVRYNVTFGFPSESHETDGDSIEPDTISVDWTGSVANNKGEKTYSYTLPESGTGYATFFSAVMLPAAAL